VVEATEQIDALFAMVTGCARGFYTSGGALTRTSHRVSSST